MTCIAAWLEPNGDIWMGGDSAGVGGYTMRVRSDEKVFIKGDMIFGFTSSFRMGQIIRSCMTIPLHYHNKTDYDYLCSDFIDSLRQSFKDKGYLKVEHSVDVGGTFLLGYKGHLYEIEDDFQVGMYHKNYASVGCGACYALGSFHANEDRHLLPDDRVKRALIAAVEFSAGVRPPFVIKCLQKKAEDPI